MRPQIKKQSRAGMIFAFAPDARFRFQAETVEARLVLRDFSQSSGSNQLCKSAEVSIPAPVLIHGEQAAARRSQLRQFLAFFQRGGKRLINDHIPASEQTRLS